MPLHVEITEEPGLHAMLSSDEPVPDDRLGPALEAFRDSPAIAGTPLEAELDDAIRRRAEAADETSGWWDALRRWLAGEHHEVVGHEEHVVELDAYWLTLPGVSGAKVTLASSVSRSAETSASFALAGIGGGPTFTLDLKEAVTFAATETERVGLSSIGSFDIVRVTKDGTVTATYPRLCDLDRKNLNWTRVPVAAPDPTPLGQSIFSRSFKASASTGTTTDKLTIVAGTTWEVGADLSFAKLGLKAKLAAKVTYEREVVYAYELPGGHDYRAVRYSAFPAFLWTVLTP